jgi:hypothetical protein
MHLRGIGREDGRRIEIAQDHVQRRDLVRISGAEH